MWKCKCGGMNPDTSKFCQSCGDDKIHAEYSEEAEYKKRMAAEEENRQRLYRQQEEQKRAAMQYEAENRRRAFEAQKKQQERMRIEHSNKIENLKNRGYNGYYEYRVINLNDDNSGCVHFGTLENALNNLGLEGWQLKCSYSNEIYKTVGSIQSPGFTIDQNVLIFERFVKFDGN